MYGAGAAFFAWSRSRRLRDLGLPEPQKSGGSATLAITVLTVALSALTVFLLWEIC